MHIALKPALGASVLGLGLLIGGAAEAQTVPSTAALTSVHPAMRQVLFAGTKGHWVATLQADLNLLGYKAGPIDGVFGPETQAALEAFQRQHGFQPTGVTSPLVWQDILAGLHLVPNVDPQGASAPLSTPSTATLTAWHPAMRQALYPGVKGHWVMTLQADLKDIGYSQVGPVDGIFGPKTEAALEAFQRQHDFIATGVTSPLVWQDILSGFGLTPAVPGTGKFSKPGAGQGPRTAKPAPAPKSTPRAIPSPAPISSGNATGPVLPAHFPTGGTPVAEPSLPNASGGLRGEFTPSVKTIDGRPVLKAYHMVATSYGPSLADNYPYGPTDAFGQPLEDGMVAVDPTVIPLHSIVYVTGYQDNFLPSGGFLGQAMDTGGAIKGDRVDIFINAPENVINDFGVQQVTVYVLG
ncbi:peptidoglycan-binding protein [Sulfobacillus harzensis]|uniref:Peptidoglycan-binding protein n=1 Tax=Sulfobacillus harzensis TaxID=2729629 RepID=A0A7Y0L4I5_9FIRM|nr:peptidoglycan-binding protein [Sulfobacillus harzensis]NMP22948.1 hypothetical protein [Sulfobacillus harzensis]